MTFLGKMSHMSACQNENDMLTPFDIKRGKCICGEAERRERLGVAAPQTLERSLVDEIQSTRDGRAALRFASENCDLRELLDLAHRIISEGQKASLTDIQAFAKGYILDMEKRK